MKSPIISIVVPSRNRHQYLAVLVRSLLAVESGDFEILVHDNSDEPGGFESATGDLNDSRLRYIYDATPMSITENFEKAVSLAAGEYVCMIGDDDGVTESIIDLAHWLKANDIDVAKSPVPTYLWPGVPSALDPLQTTGVLRLPRYSSKIEIVQSAKALARVLDSGGVRIGDLPSVYQGIVSKRALDRLFDLAGTRFPGPSPDMANAVGLSAVVNRFALVSFPVVISGVCSVSGAGEGAKHQHHGEIADRKFLPEGTADKWPPQVPFYFSGPTLWAATLIHSLKAVGKTEALSKLRYDRLYAACNVLAPMYKDRIAKARSHNAAAISENHLWIGILWIWSLRAKALFHNLFGRAQSKISKRSHATGVADIGAAINYISSQFGPIRTQARIPDVS